MRSIKYVLGNIVLIGFIISILLLDEYQSTGFNNHIATDYISTPTPTPNPNPDGTGGGNHVGGWVYSHKNN